MTRLVLALLACGLIVGLGGGVYLLLLIQDLPRLDQLVDYRPMESTKVFASDGSLVAEFFEERRTAIPPAEIPEVMKRAILAAEDSHFYQHEGLDYLGIARTMVRNVSAGRIRGGASTITQQVVKTFLLTPEQTYTRKLKEAILARQLEKNFSKDEILYLYLTQINFGHARYGVEEAARHYFAKPAKALTLGEASLLAGIPQSPTRLTPLRHPDAAKRRQLYVLGQMLDNGWITRAEHEREVAAPIRLASRPDPAPGPYYTEEIRRYLFERYGVEKTLTGGLRVELAMDPALQRAADDALRGGLLAYDRRRGWRGARGTIDPAMKAAAEAARAAAVGDGSSTGDPTPILLVDLADAKVHEARKGLVLQGAIEGRSASAAEVWMGGPLGTISAKDVGWTGKKPDKLFARGELVQVEIASIQGAKVELKLVQEPEVQGALVVLDPSTRRVRALVGGWDFGQSSFNRATQARRQPGSAFKPFVFGAALESGRWTPASVVADVPETFRDPWTGKEWKPQNYERNAFEGNMTLRRALARSKNTVAVRLISELGVDPVIDFARRSGIRSELPANMTLALGTGEITPLELANAMATLASGGMRSSPVMIERVIDRDGTVLEEASSSPTPAISPAISYVLTRLLQAVVTEGTGRGANVLGRPTAGKTGTTSDGRDAWFVGYTPDLVAVSWTGFDDPKPLGRGETGGRTALAAWVDVMKAGHGGLPIRDFPMPEGVEVAAIDPGTGLLAAEDALPADVELTAFVAGTAPTERVIAPGVAHEDLPVELFLGGGGTAAP